MAPPNDDDEGPKPIPINELGAQLLQRAVMYGEHAIERCASSPEKSFETVVALSNAVSLARQANAAERTMVAIEFLAKTAADAQPKLKVDERTLRGGKMN